MLVDIFEKHTIEMIPKSMILILPNFPKLYNEPSFANIYGPGRKIDKSVCGRKRLRTQGKYGRYNCSGKVTLEFLRNNLWCLFWKFFYFCIFGQ